ncbi:MAG TPA: DNA repair protein RecN [Oligoflexia bacterium]|nr:DNA repair protein RecN [Oligoflexia bacterium]HMP48341.1 DNA repair protein RecN [Oligoflexia bacterium]
MLATLRIENIAVIEKLELELDPGLNILTGETGAGKSIILKSLELLCGKRLAQGSIRTGASRAIVEALFILPAELRRKLLESFEVLEDVLDTDELIIRRVLDQSGRSKYYLGSMIQPGGIVNQISQILIDITGQNEQQTLRQASTQRSMLDSFGVSSELLEEVELRYRDWKKENERLESFSSSRKELELRFDRLKFEKQELDQAGIEKGERARIEAEISRLKNTDKIQNELERVLSIFGESQRSTSSLDETGKETARIDHALTDLGSSLREIARFDDRAGSLISIFESVEAELDEIRLQCRSLASIIDHDPLHFESLQQRLSEIGRLERKYRKTGDELVIYLNEITEELSAYDDGIFDEQVIIAREKEARKMLSESEENLSAARKLAAKKLAKLVSAGLKEIEMDKARFEVSVEKSDSTQHGADAVRFLFTANPGEPLQALDKVASGGEMSRVLLILKSLAREALPGSVQVFDEIDAGVSGAVAQTLGEKLLSIAVNSQVLVITHSAQVAALADRHILVSKETRNDRTFTKVNNLSEDDRLHSIARMLAGKDVSVQFELSARELLGSRRK